MAQQTDAFVSSGQSRSTGLRMKRFIFNNAPLLTTITIFVVAYLLAGRVYPAMQKPQVFFNLFINNAALLIVSIGMTLVIINLASIPVSNTSVNPARSTGPAIIQHGWALGQLWVFWLAPIVGAAIAGATYHLIVGDQPVSPAEPLASEQT